MSLLPEIEYVTLELGTRMVPHVAPISAVVRPPAEFCRPEFLFFD